jgi:hypothetical protein
MRQGGRGRKRSSLRGGLHCRDCGNAAAQPPNNRQSNRLGLRSISASRTGSPDMSDPGPHPLVALWPVLAGSIALGLLIAAIG